jgi:hypothetical protein
MKKSTKPAAAIYQIEVVLRHVDPPIWRRIQVPGDTKLGKLHRILQDAMGWTNSHLHDFRIGDNVYGEPFPESPDEVINELNVRLDKIAHEGDTLLYTYDFGDSWEHELNIEKVAPAESGVSYPRCRDGQRACPPEDCGGPWGYANLLQVLNDPNDDEHEEMREWVEEDFDPEHFDVETINRALR